MSTLLSEKYAPFVLSAYGISFCVLLGLVIWVLVVARKRRRDLQKAERLLPPGGSENE